PPQTCDRGAQYAAAGVDPDINKWYAEINAGEPYSANADFTTIVSEVGGQLRSPFRIPIPTTRKPIFSIQSLSDPLFPALQTLTEINRLKAASASYPVWAFLGDVGHSYARNPLPVWVAAHNESNAWLQMVLAGQPPTQPTITATTTTDSGTTKNACGQTMHTYTASSFGSIATAMQGFASPASQS